MKSKDFKKIIEKLSTGFTIKENGSDHKDFDIYKGQKIIGWVRRSHSLKDEHDQLIARNLFLSIYDLRRFYQCSCSIEEYIEILKKKQKYPDEKEAT